MRRALKRAAGALTLIGAVVVLRQGTRANKLVSQQLDRTGRQLRYLGGRLRGVSYRVRFGRPDPDVDDNVLADRIRSSLGGLEKRLDLPRIHVMVEDHVALLHGEVANEQQADELERAVAAVSGVVGVESHLHIGLTGSDTRPSEGRAVHPPSDRLRSLLDAAVGAGIAPDSARPVVRAILATFADRLPPGERHQVRAHLPDDVRAMFTPPRGVRQGGRVRTVEELVARVAAITDELPDDKAVAVTTAVLRALRAAVPDEAADVGAVLPRELRELWLGESTPSAAKRGA